MDYKKNIWIVKKVYGSQNKTYEIGNRKHSKTYIIGKNIFIT